MKLSTHATTIYDDASIIITLIKRWKLCVISLIICLSLGSIWTKNQIKQIQDNQQTAKTQTFKDAKAILKESARNAKKEAIAQEKELEEGLQISFIQYFHYKDIDLSPTIIDNTLLSFQQKDLITDFRPYIDSPFWTIYIIFYEGEDPTQAILTALEEHPLTQQTKQVLRTMSFTDDEKSAASYVERHGFFHKFEDTSYIPDPSQRPINKHYIYLDKNRLSQKGYNITSTEIIKNHQSLNSKKIWVFMVICSIMISVFLVFGVENWSNMRTRLRTNNH